MSTNEEFLLRLRIERERRKRRERESSERLQSAIEQARAGDVRPYVELQWPGIRLDDWQWDILESLFDPTIRGVFVKGNTGCGKGAAAGIAICMYYHIWDDAKIVITRDSAETAKEIAFGEVDKWFRKMQYRPPGQLLTTGIKDGSQHTVTIANPKVVEGFRGSHSPHVLFWFDEATAPNLEDKYSLAKTQAKKFLALSNPSTLSGHFRAAFPADSPDKTQTTIGEMGRIRCITVSGYQCTNVIEKCLEQPSAPIGGVEIDGRFYEHGEEIAPEHFELVQPIVPGQTCYDEFMALLNDPDPIVRNVYALGKFPNDDPRKQIILREWITGHRFRYKAEEVVPGMLERWANLPPVELWEKLRRLFEPRFQPGETGETTEDHRDVYNLLFPAQAFGFDVAASTRGDSSVLAAGGSYGIRGLHECRFADTQQTVDWLLETVDRHYGVDLTDGQVPIGIDWGGGYGNAVGDPLANMGVDVVQIKSNASSDVDDKKYGNKRAEMYGEAGRRLDPSGDFRMMDLILPANPQMIEELVAPQKIYSGKDGEKYYITPKERRGSDDRFKGMTLRELLGRSPDRADAVVYCFTALRDGGRPKLLIA